MTQAPLTCAALVGFERARQRYRETAAQDDATAEDVFIPLAESLSWAGSIDETLRKLLDAPYTAARDVDPDGVYLTGLRYARNRCTHQLALVVDRRHLSPPFQPPVTLGVLLRWLRSAELPPPDPKHPDPKGLAAYEEWLAGTAAESTLEHAAVWFARAQEEFGEPLQ